MNSFNIPLHYLSELENSTIEMIKYMIESKSNLNKENNICSTPLHSICQNEKIDLLFIQYLIEVKGDFNVINLYKKSPFTYASENRSLMKETKEKYGENVTFDQIFKVFLHKYN